MTTIALTESEHISFLGLAQTVDPPRRGHIVGAAQTVAEVEARVAASYNCATDGTTPPPGWSVSATYARNVSTGNVEIDNAVVIEVAAQPECPVGLKTKLEVFSVGYTSPIGVGDGVADDTDAIETAVAAVLALTQTGRYGEKVRAGILDLDGKSWRVTSEVTIAGPCQIRNGKLVCDVSSGTAFTWQPASGDTHVRAQLRDVIFCSGTQTDITGLTIDSAEMASIENCVFTGFQGGTVGAGLCLQGSAMVAIERCFFLKNRVHLALEQDSSSAPCSDIRVANTRMRQCVHSAIFSEPGSDEEYSVASITVDGCSIEQSDGDLISLEEGHALTICGRTRLEDYDGYGVRVLNCNEVRIEDAQFSIVSTAVAYLTVEPYVNPLISATVTDLGA